MEFPVGSTSTETSYLDKDDINGPGLQKYMRRTGDTSVDYALFKIAQYSSSNELSERMKFTKELDELALQLGLRNISSLHNVVKKLANEEAIEVRVELCAQIPVLAKVFIQEFNAYNEVIDNLVPSLDQLLEDKRQDVIKAACAAGTALAEILTKDDRGMVILTMILRILHDEEEETRIRALGALKDLISLLTPDICEWYILKEAMILSSENIVKVRKAVAECVPKLSKLVNNTESFEKLMKIFQELAKDSIWGVRKACVENISEMFEGLDSSIQDMYILPLFQDLLNDKSNSVRQCAMLQLGPCIYNCKVQVPEELITQYIDLSKNSANKGEFQYHCAFYLPAVLLKIGKENWGKLSPAFVYLITEADTRVKKCLIASIHEIGKILGLETATTELAPLFEAVFSESAMSKQLAIISLSRFLSVILPESRLTFLKYVKTMHKITSNWRVREIIAEQLADLIELFDSETAASELFPVIFTLADDKISKVRETAAVSLGKIMKFLLSGEGNQSFSDTFREYASGSPAKKMVFAIACQVLASLQNFPELYGKELQSLCDEKSPNIRLCCGKAIKIGKDSEKSSPFWASLEEKLSHDFDADVRFEIFGKYDVERGITKLRPNMEKAAELMPPMFRAPFPDNDLQEIINFNTNANHGFAMIKAAITPSMNGFVENLFLQSVNKQKLLINT